MTLMNSYKEKGYLVRRIVFVHSILLLNSMSNFTDHEFDKEGLIRKVIQWIEHLLYNYIHWLLFDFRFSFFCFFFYFLFFLQQSADAGFIEFACEILNDPSYRESLKKLYVIRCPEETMQCDDFNNYQVWSYLS